MGSRTSSNQRARKRAKYRKRALKRYFKKQRMWAENRHCHWCGQPTVLFIGISYMELPPNAATLDHINKRQEVVLACYKCNHERSLKGL